jgi:MFS family permease
MWLLSLGGFLYLGGQISVMGFLVLFLHDHRGVSASAAAAALGVVHVLGAVARIAAGRWSDKIGARLRPLRLLGVGLTAGLAATAVLVDAPLALLVPVVVAAGAFGFSWNGLSFTAAAESGGADRSGAAIGFQQTALALGNVVIPIAFAALVDHGSWRAAFLASALCPLIGIAVLQPIGEPRRVTPAAETL